MILEKGIIPPNALFEKWNPNIDAKLMKLAVPTRCVEWPSEGLRRISVNSFGFGGSNGHVILDDAYHALRELGFPSGNHHTRIHLTPKLRKSMPMTNGNGPSLLNGTAPAAKRQYRLLVWSAKDEEALKRTIQGYVPYLETHLQDPESLDQLAYTLSARRSIMTWRSFAVVRSDDEDKASALSTPPLVRSSPHADAGLAFIFTGQGAQYANMGMALVEYPVFRSAMEEADTVFRDLGADWSLFGM
jgi:acyl transferase domain-containing protein